MTKTLFDQTGFDWSQRAQFALLFSSSCEVQAISPQPAASQLACEQVDGIAGSLGYLKPGDDGDFAGMGFATEALRSEWLERFKRMAAAENLSLG